MSDVIDKALDLLERDKYSECFQVMAAEIERLRADRNAVIEECARAIETCRLQYDDDDYAWMILAGAADAIRALGKGEATMRTKFYDPPSGWKYGFPRPYEPLPGESLAETLLRDGYPQREIDNGGDKYVRFWVHKDED